MNQSLISVVYQGMEWVNVRLCGRRDIVRRRAILETIVSMPWAVCRMRKVMVTSKRGRMEPAPQSADCDIVAQPSTIDRTMDRYVIINSVSGIPSSLLRLLEILYRIF